MLNQCEYIKQLILVELNQHKLNKNVVEKHKHNVFQIIRSSNFIYTLWLDMIVKLCIECDTLQWTYVEELYGKYM